MIKKLLSFSIIFLFIGTSVVSSTEYSTKVYKQSDIYSIMEPPTVLLDEKFSGTFPPEGWSIDGWEQYNSGCCGSEPPCAVWYKYNQSPPFYGAHLISKAVDASEYEKFVLKFYFAADVYYNNYVSIYIKYRKNETSSWIDITPWDNPIPVDMECDYYEIEVTCGSEGCGDALQINWSYVGYYYYINYLWLDDVKILSGELTQYEPHDPIYIHGNDDFISENGVTGGSGTLNDPYIIEDWDIDASSQDGIFIRNTSVYFEIRECYVHDGGSSYDGIVFINVTNGWIKNNIITKNRNGTIFRTQKYGWKENSSNNYISQNTITDNKYDGIHFEHNIASHHSDNAIFLNNISGNNRGIFLIMSRENLIYNNNIISNSEFGVELFTCTGGGGNNKVFHNNFIYNGDERGQASCTLDYNYWDDGYPSGGNYWSDYEGEDKYSGPFQNIPGSDGIGDEPYMIFSYNENDYDWYPLMEAYSNFTIPPYTRISFNPPEPDGCNGWYISNVTVILNAEDDTGVNATYYRINGEEWETYESPFIITEEGDNIIIEYYSVDIDGNIENVKSSTLKIDKTPPNMTVEWEVNRVGWRKWEVIFHINLTDTENCVDRIEIFLNDVLQETITGPGPTYSWGFIISGGLPFTLKFIAWDCACNQRIVEVNSSEINFHPRSKSISYYSFYIWLQSLFDRFLFLQRILHALG